MCLAWLIGSGFAPLRLYKPVADGLVRGGGWGVSPDDSRSSAVVLGLRVGGKAASSTSMVTASEEHSSGRTASAAAQGGTAARPRHQLLTWRGVRPASRLGWCRCGPGGRRIRYAEARACAL